MPWWLRFHNEPVAVPLQSTTEQSQTQLTVHFHRIDPTEKTKSPIMNSFPRRSFVFFCLAFAAVFLASTLTTSHAFTTAQPTATSSSKTCSADSSSKLCSSATPDGTKPDLVDQTVFKAKSRPNTEHKRLPRGLRRRNHPKKKSSGWPDRPKPRKTKRSTSFWLASWTSHCPLIHNPSWI